METYLVTVEIQIDHISKELCGSLRKVHPLSRTHPFGQILNAKDREKFQKRGTEHMHVTIYVVGFFNENLMKMMALSQLRKEKKRERKKKA